MLTWSVAALAIAAAPGAASAADVVLYSSDVTYAQGNWSKASDATAAGGQMMSSADAGWSTTDAPLASPGDYFEATFTAPASTAYHVWLRMRAAGNSKWNDSVWVQFSDAVDQNGNPAYRIGTGGGLAVNLATDAGGSSLSGWGWQDHAYWTAQTPLVRFTGSGSHTIRVQTREDGVQIDQIVLSASTYLGSAPGSVTGDGSIVSKPGTTSIASGASGSLSPVSGSPASVPGTIEAENFDNGGEGVAYHDTSSGNNGAQYRSTDVDIESSSEGGYDIGWTTPGEWLNYTVNVTSSASYTVQLRVASPNGGTMHVGFNGPSGVWTAVGIPATGGWQSWYTVNVPVTLRAGTQQITILFDTGGVNLNWIGVSGGSGSTTSSAGSTSSASSSVSSGSLSPYSGSPAGVPGTIEAENFDNGGEGVAYHDTSSGNNGSQYRSTDVDIEASSDGGYDIGWTAAGEWLNYTVNVASSGVYTIQLKAASPSGATWHVGFNGSGVWQTVNIPATGGWQSWQTVSFTATLSAGTQQMTVLFDTSGANFNAVSVSAGSSSTGTSTSGGTTTSSSGGTTVNVIDWNIQINDNSEAHARQAMDLLIQAQPGAHIVTIEEAYTQYFNVYIDELQRQTGKTWHGAWATYCDPGMFNGSSCTSTSFQGIGLFTTFDISSSQALLFPYADCWESARPALHATINANGVPLQAWVVHLSTGGCGDNAAERYGSMSLLKSWAANYSGPQIVSGDFNADPDQIDTQSGMTPSFVDTWKIAGSGAGYTAFAGNPTMKLDYWFEDNQGRAAVQSTSVVTSTGTVSDHMPIRATFLVR